MAAPNVSGIYEIVNLVNGKKYIGSAVNFANRWRAHRRQLQNSKHHCRHLQRAWNKHGQEAFAFRVITYCARSELIATEQQAIDRLLPAYNISRTAGSTLGVKYTDEARAKISKALIGKGKGRKRPPEAIAKTAQAHRGMKRSAETRARISAKAVGRKRSKESIERGAEKLRGRARPAEQVKYLIGNTHAVGTKHTAEWKARNSALHIGRKRPKSAEYRAKISASLKGVPHSPERRAAQAAAQRGLKRRPYRTRKQKDAAGI